MMRPLKDCLDEAVQSPPRRLSVRNQPPAQRSTRCSGAPNFILHRRTLAHRPPKRRSMWRAKVDTVHSWAVLPRPMAALPNALNLPSPVGGKKPQAAPFYRRSPRKLRQPVGQLAHGNLTNISIERKARRRASTAADHCRRARTA